MGYPILHILLQSNNIHNTCNMKIDKETNISSTNIKYMKIYLHQSSHDIDDERRRESNAGATLSTFFYAQKFIIL